jgi:hypothetical protein
MTTADESTAKASAPPAQPEAAEPATTAAPSKAAAPKPTEPAAAESRRPRIEIVKPKRWDLIALAVLVVTVLLQGANLQLALRQEQGAISGGITAAFVTLQLLLCLAGLMVLGKTAKEGTIWGNLFAVGICVVGMSGVLLASALWALA